MKHEAMFRDAVAIGESVGLIASFEPTLRSMLAEFPAGMQLETELAIGALDVLTAGDVQAHDAAVVDAARRLQNRGAKAIALAQFSMARAGPQVARATGLLVFTTADSAVRELKRRLRQPDLGASPLDGRQP